MLVVKNPLANTEGTRDVGKILGGNDPPGGGNGYHSRIFTEKFHGQKSTIGLQPISHKDLDTTEQPSTTQFPMWDYWDIYIIDISISIL